MVGSPSSNHASRTLLPGKVQTSGKDLSSNLCPHLAALRTDKQPYESETIFRLLKAMSIRRCKNRSDSSDPHETAFSLNLQLSKELIP